MLQSDDESSRFPYIEGRRASSYAVQSGRLVILSLRIHNWTRLNLTALPSSRRQVFLQKTPRLHPQGELLYIYI